mgnify:CR=1 FL=1
MDIAVGTDINNTAHLFINGVDISNPVIDYYTRNESDTFLNGKANVIDVFNKTEITDSLSNKLNIVDATGLLSNKLDLTGGLITGQLRITSPSDQGVLQITKQNGQTSYFGHGANFDIILRTNARSSGRIKMNDNGGTASKGNVASIVDGDKLIVQGAILSTSLRTTQL